MTNPYAKQRIIKDIVSDDNRIQVTGYIESRINNDQLILNDKTGKINVNITNIENFNFKYNDLINIIGDLKGKVINAEIVQDMNKLNFEYYQKLYQIKKELDLV
ncbi:MAG: hypothetical protein E3J52_11785 [Promethearchaeota archaeon]|nr:MAG: hypothetical protein E3J52_11785 [Candidatus Lokiarchaeota archaeon]